jgi:uncharacterized protein
MRPPSGAVTAVEPTTMAMAFGFLTGLLVGLTGMGGGALLGPALILGLGVPPVVAVGVDLVHSALIKLVGGAIHLRRRTVDFRLVGLLLLGSLPGSLCGIALLAAARARGANPNAIVTRVLGVALVAASLALLFRVWPRGAPRAAAAELGRPWVVAAGFVVGVLVGISSVGSGSLLVAFLAVATSLPGARIVGTDVVHGALLTAPAGALHAWLGHLDPRLTLTILAGSVPGVLLGTRLSAWSPEWLLRPVLAAALMTTGLRLIR